jgi:O-antigen/teichoic acid export membrane protein
MTSATGGMSDLVRFVCVAAPKIAGGGLQVLFNLILIRYLTPDQFGMVSLCVLGIVACDAVLGSALDMAVLRLAPLHERRGERLESLKVQNAALALKPLGVGLLALPLFFAGGAVSRALFHHDEGRGLLLLSLAGLLGLLLLRSLQLHYQISNRFVAFGLTDLAQNGIKFGGITLLLVLAVESPTWMVLFYALGPLSVALAGLALTRNLVQTTFDRSSLLELGKVLRWYVAATVMGSITSRIDVFMVSAFSTVAEAGVFSVALAMAIVPQLIGTYMAVVYGPRIMPLWEEGRLGPIYRKFQLKLLPVCIAGYFCLAIGIQLFGEVLLPASFARAAGVMLVLFPASLCSLLNFPWTISLLLFLRPKFLLALELVSFIVVIPAYAYSAGRWGALGGAAVTVTAAAIKTIAMQIMAWQVARTPASMRAEPSLAVEGL